MSVEDEILFRDRLARLRREQAVALEVEANTVIKFGFDAKNQSQKDFWLSALQELDRMILAAKRDANMLENLRASTGKRPATHESREVSVIKTEVKQNLAIIGKPKEVVRTQHWWDRKIPGPLQLLGFKKKT